MLLRGKEEEEEVFDTVPCSCAADEEEIHVQARPRVCTRIRHNAVSTPNYARRGGFISRRGACARAARRDKKSATASRCARCTPA